MPIRLAALVLVLAWPCGAPAQFRYAVTDLGPIDHTHTGAMDINNAGQVTLNLNGTGYVWQNGTSSPPGGLTNNNTAFAINAGGHLAWTLNVRAMYWNGQTTTTLPQLEPGPDGITSARDINASNVVVGSSRRPSINQYRGFAWNGTTMTDLGGLVTGGGSHAMAINDAGVVVGLVGPSTNQPGRWEAGLWTALPLLPGGGSGGANAVNNSGVIAGYTAQADNASAERATAWVDGQAVDLGAVDGLVYSVAYGINDHGHIVGAASEYTNSGTFGFVHRGGKMYSLTALLATPGYWVMQANAINDAGQIVGLAQVSGDSTYHHAVLLTPVPEPSALALAGFAAAGVAYRRLRRQPT